MRSSYEPEKKAPLSKAGQLIMDYHIVSIYVTIPIFFRIPSGFPMSAKDNHRLLEPNMAQGVYLS